MLKEIIVLSTICFISYIYNITIYPLIINNTDVFIYNNIITSFIILIQIDNYNLLNENKINNNNHNEIEDKYIKIILNQIDYINRKHYEINKTKIKYKRTTKSYNDLSNI